MILFVNAEGKVAVTLMKTRKTECFQFSGVEEDAPQSSLKGSVSRLTFEMG